MSYDNFTHGGCKVDRPNIGCARGQRTTQFCADAAWRDAVITKVLSMLREDAGEEPVSYTYPEDPRLLRWQTVSELYSRACEIAGRAE